MGGGPPTGAVNRPQRPANDANRMAGRCKQVVHFGLGDPLLGEECRLRLGVRRWLEDKSHRPRGTHNELHVS